MKFLREKIWRQSLPVVQTVLELTMKFRLPSNLW